MSKYDAVKVKFSIPEGLLSNKKLRDLIKVVFGVDTEAGNGPCQIKCPASMFAIFIVKRNDSNITNTFQQLSPELIIPECLGTIPDVGSMNFDID